MFVVQNWSKRFYVCNLQVWQLLSASLRYPVDNKLRGIANDYILNLLTLRGNCSTCSPVTLASLSREHKNTGILNNCIPYKLYLLGDTYPRINCYHCQERRTSIRYDPRSCHQVYRHGIAAWAIQPMIQCKIQPPRASNRMSKYPAKSKNFSSHVLWCPSILSFNL